MQIYARMDDRAIFLGSVVDEANGVMVGETLCRE